MAILDRAAEGGIDFLDTSDAYPLGGDLTPRGAPRRSSAAGCTGKRDRFILGDQVLRADRAGPFDAGNSRKHIFPRSRPRCGACRPTTSTCTSCTATTGDADRRDPGSARRSRAPGQGPLHRLLQLPDLSAGPGRRPERDAAARPPSTGAAPLQPALPPDRARNAPVLREDGVGVIPYNPIAGGLLSGKHNRSARRRRAPASPWATPAGTTRTATGTTASSTRSTHSARWPSEAGVSLVTLAVAWVLANPADHRADHRAPAAPDQLDASLAAAEFTLDAELKRSLDELTHDYRMGDAPR